MTTLVVMSYIWWLHL